MNIRNYFPEYKILTIRQRETNMKNKLLQRERDNTPGEV